MTPNYILMKQDLEKFIKKQGIKLSAIPSNHIETVEIDVTAQSAQIIKILDENSIKWSQSPNRYGGASEFISIVVDYWELFTLLQKIYKVCGSSIAFIVKIKGSSKPIKMLIADYLRYLADKINKEE